MAEAKTRGMSDQHKEALATGRNQSRAVKAYLAALKSNKPKRGRKRTAESKELQTIGNDVDLSELEAEFIKVGLGYSNSKGIDYSTWRKVGVSAETLAKAGIKRS